jgi:hypothetical protein
MVSQARKANFSWTVQITFREREIASSVSVMLPLSFASLPP